MKNGDKVVILHSRDILEYAEELRLTDDELGRLLISWWRWAKSGAQETMNDPKLDAICIALRQQTSRDRERRARAARCGACRRKRKRRSYR